MTGMKVHGLRESTCTRKVLAVLYEKGLEFEFVHVELKDGEHKREPYLSLNPFGQIPAFEDGDLKLFESRSITQYLAHGHPDTGNQLLYLGNKNLARMLVWMEAEAHQFDPVASKLAWEQVFKGMFGMPTDHAAVEEGNAKLAKVLDVYEARLSKSKYLACDSYTLADLHHVPVIQYLLGTPTKKLFDERPHVSAWVANILARPASQKLLQ